MSTLLLALSALLPGSPPPAVLRVGPAQAHATIGQALVAAAPGDLILVDPGTYPAFSVGLPVTIAASSGPFDVQQGAGAPAITIAGIVGTLVLDGARIAFTQPGAPAIAIVGCTGDVHLTNVTVDAAGDLIGTAARAAIEASACADLVFERLSVRGAVARRGSTGNPDGANTGLSAVRLENANFVLRDCLLRGYDAPVGGAYAGDALRVVAPGAGAANGWSLADVGTSLLGGSASGNGSNGGNCLHQYGPGLLVELCGMHHMVPGTGGARSGGYYAIDDDGGQVAPGVGRMIPACLLEAVALTSSPSILAPGAAFTISVADFAGGAACMTFLSLGSRFRSSFPAVSGRILLDLNQTVTLAMGVTPAAFPQTIPPSPWLSGTLFTLQSAVFGPNGWPMTVTSWPTFVSIR